MGAEKVIEIQQDIKHKAEDYRAFLDDLKVWESDIRKKDAAVAKKNKIEADYPPVRGTVNEDQLLKAEEQKQKEDPIQREKALGNEFFKKGKYGEAIKHYTKGINCDPDDANVHLLYANRAMSHLKLEKWSEAEQDATKCVQCNRTFTKGFFRRALARKGAGNLKDAVADLNTVLVLEPDNKEARTLLAQLQADIKKQEKAAAPPAQRKKLQIQEVDDDDDDDDDDDEEVEIPIKRKEAPKEVPKPQTAPKPAPTHVDPMQSSGVEVIDDEEEERGKALLPTASPVPAPKPAQAAVPTPAPTPTPTPAVPVAPAEEKAKAEPQNASSPKGGKAFVPREEAVNAAKQFLEKGDKEIPKNFLQFERVWNRLKQDEKPAYLYMIPTAKLTEFFTTNLTEDILGEVVAVMHSTVGTNPEENNKKVFAVIKQLSVLDRLSALLLFLDDAVATQLKAIPPMLKGIVPDAELKKVAINLKKRMEE
eukprot:TRINITY_DN7485_c0_g3_i2.p1 TRINITY_DN7485_c0_g3~~TRINITY_DN7485_c0_g3_i2.p1  ORF type:complete len:478 (+),score=206.41 TRINITY_DN7485_c0_g3_i2:53-1486(+)